VPPSTNNILLNEVPNNKFLNFSVVTFSPFSSSSIIASVPFFNFIFFMRDLSLIFSALILDIRLLDILDTNYKQTFLSISKEISKINEGTRRGKIIDIIQYKDHDFFKKGEFVIVLENLVKKDIDSNLEGIETLLKSLKKEGLTLKQSVNVVKKHCKISKKIIYNQALIVWDENS